MTVNWFISRQRFLSFPLVCVTNSINQRHQIQPLSHQRKKSRKPSENGRFSRSDKSKKGFFDEVMKNGVNSWFDEAFVHVWRKSRPSFLNGAKGKLQAWDFKCIWSWHRHKLNSRRLWATRVIFLWCLLPFLSRLFSKCKSNLKATKTGKTLRRLFWQF